MRIIYVCREVAPVTGGGIGTYISNVAKLMSANGHEVTVVTDFLGEEPGDLHSFGSVRFVQPKLFEPERLGDFMCEHQAYSFRVYETLLELLSSGDVDIIEFPEFRGEGFASIRAKRTLNHFENCKLVVKCHTPFSLIREINDDYFHQPRHEMDIFMEDYSVLHADQVTSPSSSLKAYFQNRLNRSDIQICPYPLELPESGKRETPINAQLKYVRFIGSIQPRKGVDHFIAAALKVLEKDQSFEFEIIGGERNHSVLWKSYSDLLKSRIPERHLARFHFSGAKPAEEIPSVLARTSICVLPSRWENWANICLEAMSMGCIVCASSQGGMGEMIQHGKNGFHVDPLNSNKTARLILSIASKSSIKLQKISNNAVSRARQLSKPEDTLKRIEANYKQSVSRSPWKRIQVGSEPLVTVIIPYYNQKKTVQDTVESVQGSTYRNLEILVVNDGSSDTEAVEVFNKLEGVVKLNKGNGGLSSARNHGIQHAKGDYFLPLDSDDLIEPTYIEKAVAFLIQHPEVSYVGCHARNFGAFEGNYSPLGFIKPLMAFQNTDIKCCALFRKKSSGYGYDEEMYSYEDWDFLIDIHERDGIGEIIPESLFQYRRYYDSMVFSTANHQKSHLLQYMLNKHAFFWENEYSNMCRILVRLWSDEQFERNFRNIEIMQVYYGVEGAYSEQNSSILTVYRGQWQNVKFRLPGIGNITTLRIDPCACPSFIRIKRVQLVNTVTRKPLAIFNDSVSFENVSIGGTATGGWDGKSFVIHSTGDDPQIHIDGLSTGDEKVDLEIDLMLDSPD